MARLRFGLLAVAAIALGCTSGEIEAPVQALLADAYSDGGAIFVDRNSTSVRENGSARAPFRTITQGLELARARRFGASSESQQMIVVHVAPGTYVGSFDREVFDSASSSYDPAKEKLPLLLNIPRLHLLGATRLDYDGALPSSVVPGTETIVRTDLPQGPKQYVVMVTRTVPLAGSGFSESQEMAGDEVSISGLVFEAQVGRQLPSALVAIDGVSGFVVRDNLLTKGAFAIWTRLASGRIEGNLAIDNTVGITVTGGSRRFPATVEVRRNRVRGETGGVNVLGAGETGNRRVGLDFGPNRFGRVPLPAVFDRLLSPDDVPDEIRAEVVGNETTVPTGFGIRVAGYVQDPYLAVAGQDEVANISAEFRDNVSRSNAYYGLVVDAGQIALGERRVVNMRLTLEDNSLTDNGVGPAIFSMWRYAGSARLGSPTPFTQPNPTFVHNSVIEVCGDVTRFHFDNRQNPDPPTNPHAPLNNRLTVNKVSLRDICVGNDGCTEEVPAASRDCGAKQH